MNRLLQGSLLAGLCICPAAALAVDGEWLGVDWRLNTRLSTGVAVRTQDRASDLIAKLANPGQQLLCAPDDCMSANGDPAPNQRLVDAPGGFGLTNSDDGNLNYDKGDVTAATTLLAPELTLRRGLVSFTVSGMLFYDPVNAGFDEFHADDRYQPERVPRALRVEDAFAVGAEVRDAYVRAFIPLLGTEIGLSVGAQSLPWGEANLVLFTSLNEINPLDGAVANFPGFQIADVLTPVPLAIAQVPLGDVLSAELVYQFGWEAVRPPPAGSFLSTSDIAGQGNDYIMLGLGNTNDDPEGLSMPAGNAALISSASRRVQRLPDNEPDDSGQYGLRLSYYAEWLNFGTELAFHYLRYHSRFPIFSTFAGINSCARDAAANNFAAVFAACEGFNGSINPAGGRDPLPVDTVTARLDYPEDIDLFGVSFNTNFGDWAITGEASYRPNLPVQIHQTDVFFAALGPTFPEESVVIGPGDLPGVPGTPGVDLYIPGEDPGVPDYISQYRNITIGPGDYVPGFHRIRLGQLSLSGLRIWSTNLFDADQLLLLVEAGMSHIFDRPGAQVLPLQAAGDFTHPSPGADGTGGPPPDGEPATNRQNPTFQNSNIVTDTAWGWRGLVQLTYNEVLRGLTLTPRLVWFHDIKGYSPAPYVNFIEGRKQIISSVDASFGVGWTAGVSYNWYTGGGNANLERDRDHAKLFLAYEF